MLDLPHSATYTFEYSDPDRAGVIGRAVAREVGEIDDDRSTARLDRCGRTVDVRIEAADFVALRAATNTWLTLVAVAERAVAATER